MSNLTEEFKKLIWKKEVPDENLLVPLLMWASGFYPNIEPCQKINRRFFWIPKSINSRSLFLSNRLVKFIRFPKAPKQNDELKFFHKDLCTYFGWTSRELEKNKKVLDVESLKETIAEAFGYEDKERRKLGLEGLKYGKRLRREDSKTIKTEEMDEKGTG